MGVLTMNWKNIKDEQPPFDKVVLLRKGLEATDYQAIEFKSENYDDNSVSVFCDGFGFDEWAVIDE